MAECFTRRKDGKRHRLSREDGAAAEEDEEIAARVCGVEMCFGAVKEEVYWSLEVWFP